MYFRRDKQLGPGVLVLNIVPNFAKFSKKMKILFRDRHYTKMLVICSIILEVSGDIFHLLRFMVANESERICPFVPVELKMSGSVTFVPSLSRVMHGPGRKINKV